MSRLCCVQLLPEALSRGTRFGDARFRQIRPYGHPRRGMALAGNTTGCGLMCRLLQASPIHPDDPQ